MPEYTIEFRFTDDSDPVYAGMYKGAFGWAPRLETALIYSDEETAQRVLDNCYGNRATEYGHVIEVNPE